MKTLFAILTLTGLLLMNSCSESQKEDSHGTEQATSIAKDVDATEFKSLIDKADGILLDVRTPQECAGGMIEGASNIDYSAGDFKGKVADLDKNKPVYIYCASGGRSAGAMKDMSAMGFKEVYNLLGGYRGWPHK